MKETLKVATACALTLGLMAATMRCVMHEPDVGAIIGEEFAKQGFVIVAPPEPDMCRDAWTDHDREWEKGIGWRGCV